MNSHVGRRAIWLVAMAATLAVQLLPPKAMAQGESAVPFLLISPNSRSSGIGESGTGTVDDASAIFWNPAALAFLDGTEISLTHANWLPQFQQSDLFYDHLNFRTRVDGIGGTVGASVTYLNLGEFIKTGESGPQELGRFKAFEFAVVGGYATTIFDDLGLGINLRYIRSQLSPFGAGQEEGEGIASTVSVDVAMMYRPSELVVPLIGDLGKKFSAGFNLSNLGPKLTYIDAAQADPLPTNLRVGLGYRIFEDEYNSLTASLDFSRLLVRRRAAVLDSSGKVITPASVDGLPKSLFSAWGDNGFKKVITSTGLEYWYGSPKLIALRIGYFYESPDFGNRKFLTFGAGIRYDIYGFDFSYISAAENHPLSDTIRLSLLIGWDGG